MDATNLTREQLAQYILNTAKDSVVNKIKKVVLKEQQQTFVGYTVNGTPLNPEQYSDEIKKGIEDIELGRVTDDQELDNEIKNW